MTSYALLMLQGGDGHWTTRNKAVTKPMRSILKRWDPNSDAYKFRIYLRNHWSHLRLLQKADEKLKWELLWQIPASGSCQQSMRLCWNANSDKRVFIWEETQVIQ